MAEHDSQRCHLDRVAGPALVQSTGGYIHYLYCSKAEGVKRLTIYPKKLEPSRSRADDIPDDSPCFSKQRH